LANGESMNFMDYITIGAHLLPLFGSMAEVGAGLMGKTREALERLRFGYAMEGARGEQFEEMRNIAQAGISCFLCMAPDTPTWTPEGTVNLSQISPGQLVLTAGDRMIDPQNGRAGTYGETEVGELWYQLGKMPFRPVHLRIERADGSATDIVELVRSDELARRGLYEPIAPNTKIWMNSVSDKLDGPSNGGYARLLGIGDEVKLGDGIGVPTPEAAPVMAVSRTTQSTLLAVSLDGWSKPLLMTAVHPVWSEDDSEWRKAGDLKVGDKIRAGQGRACVQSVAVAQNGATVYNLTVAGGHTYFVGQEKAWVHNACIGEVFERYSEAANLTRGQGGEIQAHHLIEARHFRNWEMPTDGPAVILTRADHLEITNDLRAALPYGREYTPAQVRAAYMEVYAGHSEWLAAIRRHMRW
jgi:hypothetical protein